jgi:hypothetical protein
MKCKAIKDIPICGFDTKPNEIKKDTICDIKMLDGVAAIKYKDKWVCDCDSQMMVDYFELIKE